MINFKSVNLFFIFFLVTAIVARVFIEFSYAVFIIALVSWLLLTMAGSAFIRFNYFFKSQSSNRKVKKPWVSITFDDGPNPEFTPKVLTHLKKYNAKATFFCIGNNIQSHPEMLKQIIDGGHTIGNHTYNHSKNFGFHTTEKVISELNSTTELIKKVTGKVVKMYRPAFGVTNPRIRNAVQQTNLYSIGWNKRSLDTLNYSKDYSFKRITKNLQPGDIILLHDSSDKSVAVLERLLLFLQEQELESVTVDQLLNLEPYE